MKEIVIVTTPYGTQDNVLHIKNEATSTISYSFGDILEIDNEYTFSCWFKAEKATTITIYISNQHKDFAVTTSWQKLVFTAKSTIAKSKEVLFTIPAGVSLYAYQGQLEIGSKATDFRLNQKDIQNSINQVNNKIITLQTDFTVEQGKINSLIKETTIDNGDGTTTSLKDALNETKSTVEGNKTTIANIKTDVDTVSGKVTKMDSRITTVETTANGLKTSVSQAQTEASNALSKANSANSTAEASQTLAEQTASKFNWIVKSGTSASNFTLTDRTAQLVADNINLNGRVTFKGLDKETQDKINQGGDFTIGGRNIIKKSNITHTTSEYLINKYSTSVDLVAGESYTVQVWGSLGEGKEYLGLWFDDGSVSASVNNKVLLPNKTYGVLTFTMPTVKNTKSVLFYAVSSNTKVSCTITKVKLEKGNKPTDYSPDPADIQDVVDNWAKDAVVSGETVINGGYIQTNTIKTDQLAVEDVFSTGSAVMNIINAQEINANRITSGLLSAERINAYGLNIINKETNQQTFNVSNEGEVTMRGSVASYNYVQGKTGWAINNDGTAEFNDIIARGSVITNDGGIASSGGSGKNLLLNSSFENNLDNWNGTNYIITSEEGYKCAKVEGALTTTKTLTQSVFSRIKKDTTTHYTISAWVKLVNYKAGTTNPFCALYFGGGYNNNGTSTFLGSTTISGSNNIIPQNGKGWQYISYTFRFAQVPTYMNFQVYTRDFTGTLYIRDVKLEEGDVATAWSAAEDDKTKQVRFWAGKSYAERESAPWIVYSDGSMKATQGEFSGVFSGTVDIGNIKIQDPSATAGGDALLTIQNGQDGIKKVQLTDLSTSTFAQDIVIANNTYSPMITLKQDGSGLFSRGINVADSVILNSSSLTMDNKILTTGTNGFIVQTGLDVGTAEHGSNLTVHGNMTSEDVQVNNVLRFGSVIKFTTVSNGLNIDYIGG